MAFKKHKDAQARKLRGLKTMENTKKVNKISQPPWTKSSDKKYGKRGSKNVKNGEQDLKPLDLVLCLKKCAQT